MTAEEKIKESGYELPANVRPQGAYNPGVICGNVLYTAGQTPRKDGVLQYTGKVGTDLTLEEAQAAAEVQWQKDFERLKFRRRDWRTAEFGSLSASDEAVRQVAFAKEEKAAADRAVIETAENTRNLAEKLDELLQIKG